MEISAAIHQYRAYTELLGGIEGADGLPAVLRKSLVMILVVLHPHHWVSVLPSPSVPQTCPHSPWQLELLLYGIPISHFSAVCLPERKPWRKCYTFLQVGLTPTFSFWHLSVTWICCHTSVLLLLSTIIYPNKILAVSFHRYFFILSSILWKFPKHQAVSLQISRIWSLA